MAVEFASLDGVRVAATHFPADPVEVAAMLVDAREREAALVPSGGASKLHWGNRSDGDPLERMDLGGLAELLDVDADEGIATVGAGVPLAELERVANECGKRTRLPGLFEGATVGGTIAADPISAETRPDTRLRNELLGLEVALPNGEVTRSGGSVVKNVTGFDLVRMYCGSLGTLGVITRATLRLWPLPELRCVRVLALGSVDVALESAQALFARGVEPTGVAVMPDEAGARLLWVVEGARVDAEERASRVGSEPADEACWAEISRAVAGAPNGGLGVRLSARPSDTLPICRAVLTVGGRLRVALPALGVVLADVDEGVLAYLERAAVTGSWTLFVEHASDGFKARRDVFMGEPEGLSLMRALKRRFDPARVLNPGRFVGRI